MNSSFTVYRYFIIQLHLSISLFVYVIKLLYASVIQCLLYIWCHLLICKSLYPTVEFNTAKGCFTTNLFTKVDIHFSFLALTCPSSLSLFITPLCLMFFPLICSVSLQLLAIVQQKAMLGVVDSTLKFALSALWNLTDEMPTAARNFIECQGLELYEEVLEVVELQEYTDINTEMHPHTQTSSHAVYWFVLQSYYTEPSIQQKVLGLLVGSVCVCIYVELLVQNGFLIMCHVCHSKILFKF